MRFALSGSLDHLIEDGGWLIRIPTRSILGMSLCRLVRMSETVQPENPQPTFDSMLPAIHSLINAYRDRCLWFLDATFMPKDREQALRALTFIERYGDRSAFIQARELRECLSRLSSAASAG